MALVHDDSEDETPSERPVASSWLMSDEADIEIREPSRADHEWVARHLRAW